MADVNEDKSSSRGSRAKSRMAGAEVPAEGEPPVNELSFASLSGLVQESDQLQALAPLPAMGGTTTSGNAMSKEDPMSKEDEIVKRLDALKSCKQTLTSST